MAIQQLIDEIAKAVVVTDVQDLPELVALQQQFLLLREQIDSPQLGALEQLAGSAAEMLEEIVLREIEDVEAAFDHVREEVDRAQDIIRDAESARDSEGTSGSSPDEPEDDIDQDLLDAWISGCSDLLSHLETTVVEIDATEDPSELVAEVRRGIHTLKGEAGVLSLHEAQKLCHEAESLIDTRVEEGEGFPVDQVLALLDWLTSYITQLAEDPRAPAPAHDELLRSLTAKEHSDADDAPVCDDVAGADEEVQPAADDPIEAPVGEDDDEPIEFPSDLGLDENLNDFICEAREHIEAAEEALLELEEDPENGDLIDTVFRAFHTIKGVAGFMNLTPIVELAHTAETLLDHVRNGDIQLNSAYLDLILQSCDLLGCLIGTLEGQAAPTRGAMARLIQQLNRATEVKLDASCPRSPEQAPDATFHPLGEVLVGLGMTTNEQVESALRQQKQGALRLRSILIEAGLTNTEKVEASLVTADETGKRVHKGLVALGFIDEQALCDAIEEHRRSGARIGELLGLSSRQVASALHQQRQVRRNEAVESDGKTPPPGAAASSTEKMTKPAAQVSPTKKRVEATVKVSTTRMDSIVTMVGELVIAQQMVVQDPTIQSVAKQRVQRNLSHVGKIIRDLQEVSMSLRMVTVKATFQKMARLVRDISVKSGKKIKLTMNGEDTELDRNVVEELSDPLVHMIRNSCDHGIESTEERLAAGKSETGSLTLGAFHQGGSIVIEVKDDGRGLSREKILAKAIERGIIPPDRDPNDISDSEVHNLIFDAGFSTADVVTDISGRGVGLDVVRRNIQALRGKVEISSTPGQGSTFYIRLPLTMAIIDGMVVRVANERYVVPTLAIEHSYRPTPDQLHSVTGKGEMASARGELLPIHRLKKVLRLKDGHDNIDDGLLIVVESNSGTSCLFVDEIIGQQQVVIKTLGTTAENIRGVSGGAILGDGRVALILDIDGLVTEANEQEAA